MTNDHLLQPGVRIVVSLMFSERKVSGTVDKVDAIYFPAGVGQVLFPHLVLNTDGSIELIPLESVASIQLIP